MLRGHPPAELTVKKNILVIGAGMSTSVLVEYLLGEADAHDWHVTVVDRDVELARTRVAGHPRGQAGELDAGDERARRKHVAAADLVVSMLPAHLHAPVVEACVDLQRHFVSASYVSPDVRALGPAAGEAGVALLCEMGVDPGIDHMSAMEQLDGLRARGATITAFETFTGGLVAPESDDNPWNYKLTWNPRNVVLAGQAGAKFLHQGQHKYIPYHQIFRRYEALAIPGHGAFEGYPNRDSLEYRHHYGLEGVETIYRGTLRRPGFCDAWHCLVQLGLTDDSYELEQMGDMTYRDLVDTLLEYDPGTPIERKLRAYLGIELDSDTYRRLAWLGLFERRAIGLRRATPAQALQKLLESKWRMAEGDRDMVAMLHKVEYELDGKSHEAQSSMVVLGSAQPRTAMATTVGLTAGIGAKLLLSGEITRRGVIVPTAADVYGPVLAELRRHGVVFTGHEEEAP